MAKTYEIGVIPRDGTGPEVIAEGLKVLKAVAEKTDMEYNLVHYDLVDLTTGEVTNENRHTRFKVDPIPATMMDICRQAGSLIMSSGQSQYRKIGYYRFLRGWIRTLSVENRYSN
jgi:isocitrate/isopropylmalate dehydrogenase